MREVSLKEFTIKLQEIEANRKDKKSKGFFSAYDASINISKTDEQIINLIKSFPVPNAKEDMLEFMILATSKNKVP